MAQQIDIGIKAGTSPAEAGINKLEKAADGVADAFGNITARADMADAAIRRVLLSSERLHRVQEILKRETGKDISATDAQKFIGNFEKIRGGRGIGSKRVGSFNTFEDWYQGHSGSFRNPSDADRHRRMVMSVGMQGTDYVSQNGVPPASPPGEGAPDPQKPSTFDGGVQRVGSMAMAFSKGMLAVAGITSLMGMVGQAADLGTEESVGTDTLKRRSGDLGIEFEKLQEATRAATAGLGLTYVESNRLAQEFVHTAGTLHDVNLRSSINAGAGLSRSFGMDPAEGTQFIAVMRRLQVTGGDDASNRKLALLIGDAVERSGYSGKADEIIAAVSDFATKAARISLNTPNIGAYAGALSSLSGSGVPGLDPASAAALLGAADAAMRQGGAMGQASQNFSFAALRAYTPNISPVQAEALEQGGLFATTRQVFGPKSELGGALGTPGIGFDDVTNFEKIRRQLHASYHGDFLLEAMKNQFGLQSIADAKSLDAIDDTSMSSSANLLQRSGVDFTKIGATSIAGIARVANAKNSDLGSIYNDVIKRPDITDGERSRLSRAYDARIQNPDQLRQELARALAAHDQEATKGKDVRQSVVDLKDELTRVGGEVIQVLNPIRDSVEAIAQVLAPEKYKLAHQAELDKTRNFDKEYRGRQGNWLGGHDWLTPLYKSDRKTYDKAAAGGKPVDINSIVPHPGVGESPDSDSYLESMARIRALEQYKAAGGPGGARRPVPSSGNAPTQPRDVVLPKGGQSAARTPASGELVTLHTKGGIPYSVNKSYAGAFTGFVGELEKRGYKINSISGYNNRDISGTSIPSYHAQGAAIDVNAAANPVGAANKNNLPSDISSLAHKYGLGWGGDWTSKKDPMHFSVAQSEGGTVPLSHYGAITLRNSLIGLPAKIAKTIEPLVKIGAGNVINTKTGEIDKKTLAEFIKTFKNPLLTSGGGSMPSRPYPVRDSTAAVPWKPVRDAVVAKPSISAPTPRSQVVLKPSHSVSFTQAAAETFKPFKGTPLPSGKPAVASAAHSVTVAFEAATVHLVDKNGKQIGTAKLAPYVPAAASGGKASTWKNTTNAHTTPPAGANHLSTMGPA